MEQNPKHNARGQNQAFADRHPVVDLINIACKKTGKRQDDGNLRQLSRLNSYQTRLQPSGCAKSRAAKNEHHQQKHGNQRVKWFTEGFPNMVIKRSA